MTSTSPSSTLPNHSDSQSIATRDFENKSLTHSPRHSRSVTISISTTTTSTSPQCATTDPSLLSPTSASIPPSLSPFDPPPAYVALAAASQIVTDDYHATYQSSSDPSKLVVLSEEALSLLNSYLDYILYAILASARCARLSALRPAIVEVLKSKLARNAVAVADEELTDLLAGGVASDYDDSESDSLQLPPSGSAKQATTVSTTTAPPISSPATPSCDLNALFRCTRVRVMVYTRLGELEDEDEELYLQTIANSGFLSHTHISGAFAIYLTSILEYIAEKTLIISGKYAFARLAAHQPLPSPSLEATDSSPHRIIVEGHDFEKLAFSSTLGRLYRTWRIRVRSSNIQSPLHRPSFPLSSRTSSEQSSNAGACESYISASSSTHGDYKPDLSPPGRHSPTFNYNAHNINGNGNGNSHHSNLSHDEDDDENDDFAFTPKSLQSASSRSAPARSRSTSLSNLPNLLKPSPSTPLNLIRNQWPLNFPDPQTPHDNLETPDLICHQLPVRPSSSCSWRSFVVCETRPPLCSIRQVKSESMLHRRRYNDVTVLDEYDPLLSAGFFSSVSKGPVHSLTGSLVSSPVRAGSRETANKTSIFCLDEEDSCFPMEISLQRIFMDSPTISPNYVLTPSDKTVVYHANDAGQTSSETASFGVVSADEDMQDALACNSIALSHVLPSLPDPNSLPNDHTSTIQFNGITTLTESSSLSLEAPQSHLETPVHAVSTTSTAESSGFDSLDDSSHNGLSPKTSNFSALNQTDPSVSSVNTSTLTDPPGNLLERSASSCKLSETLVTDGHGKPTCDKLTDNNTNLSPCSSVSTSSALTASSEPPQGYASQYNNVSPAPSIHVVPAPASVIADSSTDRWQSATTRIDPLESIFEHSLDSQALRTSIISDKIISSSPDRSTTPTSFAHGKLPPTDTVSDVTESPSSLQCLSSLLPCSSKAPELPQSILLASSSSSITNLSFTRQLSNSSRRFNSASTSYIIHDNHTDISPTNSSSESSKSHNSTLAQSTVCNAASSVPIRLKNSRSSSGGGGHVGHTLFSRGLDPKQSCEERERDFDTFVKSRNTVKLKLVSPSMLDIGADEVLLHDSSTAATTAKPVSVSRSFSIRKAFSPATACNKLSKDYPSNDPGNGIASRNTYVESVSTASIFSSSSINANVGRVAACRTQPKGTSGTLVSRKPSTKGCTMIAREPRVQTESLRDFAEFIRSTGPALLDKSYKTVSSKKSRSSMVYRSNSKFSRPRSPTPLAMRSSGLSSTKRKSSILGTPMEPRSAIVSATDNTALIDFIRQGPPASNDDPHHIPRCVAPFRSTFDSDQFEELGTTRAFSTNDSSLPFFSSIDIKLSGFSNADQFIEQSRSAQLQAGAPHDWSNSSCGVTTRITTNIKASPTSNRAASSEKRLRDRLDALDEGMCRKDSISGNPSHINQPSTTGGSSHHHHHHHHQNQQIGKTALPQLNYRSSVGFRTTREESLIDFLRNVPPPNCNAPAPLESGMDDETFKTKSRGFKFARRAATYSTSVFAKGGSVNNVTSASSTRPNVHNSPSAGKNNLHRRISNSLSGQNHSGVFRFHFLRGSPYISRSHHSPVPYSVPESPPETASIPPYVKSAKAVNTTASTTITSPVSGDQNKFNSSLVSDSATSVCTNRPISSRPLDSMNQSSSSSNLPSSGLSPRNRNTSQISTSSDSTTTVKHGLSRSSESNSNGSGLLPALRIKSFRVRK